MIELLAIGRPPGYAARKAAIFDWQFKRNPDRGDASSFVIGEVAPRTIAALGGLVPVRIRFHGEPRLACWSCDTYVSPEHRGFGFGTQLVDEVSRAAPVMLCYGISDMSDPIYQRHGWLRHPGVQLLFFHAAEPGLRGHVKNWMSRIARVRKVRVRARECDVTAHLTRPLADEIDTLWRDSAPGYASAVERDATYLRWKYFEHPVHRYLCYSLRAFGALQAVMIARPDPAESVLADYCGPAFDTGAMTDLASAVVRDLVDHGTRRIRCETTHEPLARALHRVGFVRSRHASRFRVRAPRGGDDPLKGWLLMAGDSDGDVLGTFGAGFV